MTSMILYIYEAGEGDPKRLSRDCCCILPYVKFSRACAASAGCAHPTPDPYRLPWVGRFFL